MAMQLTAHFTLDEFEDASNAPLSAIGRGNALHFAAHLLEPLRRAACAHYGVSEFPIIVTSFYRRGDDKAHGEERGVDFSVPGNDPALLRWMWIWLATHKPREFGQLIYERNHLHATTPGFNKQVGAVYEEKTEGRYTLASFAPAASALLVPGMLLAWLVAARA
jgi:hypothetical protein